MIVLDANILFYAYDASSARHSQARATIERILSEDQTVGIPWQTVSAFLGIVTHKSLPGQRFSIEEASSLIGPMARAAQRSLSCAGRGTLDCAAPVATVGASAWPDGERRTVSGPNSGKWRSALLDRP